MTGREPDAHPLHPKLTLASLTAVLPSWVRPDPEREDWVVVLRERLPAAMTKKLIRHLVRDGLLKPVGQARLPRADWEWLCEQFLTQARSVLDSRDALLLAEAGPPSDEIAWSPHVEDWRAMDFGVVRPHLVGRIVGPRPGEPDAFGPRPLMALGPGQAWARVLTGWVSLGRRDEGVSTAEPRQPFPPRPMDPGETDARLAELRREIETQVADLVPSSGNPQDDRFMLALLGDPPRPALANKGKEGTPGADPAGPDPRGRAEALTAAEQIVVQIYRIFGDEMPFWLLRRNPWLGRERPIDLLAREGDHQHLAEHLSALEAGVYL